jgi:hypothetical protein
MDVVQPRLPDGRIRVGFLGNFAHQATVDSALALLRAPVADSISAEVVLGGWASDQRPEVQDRGATITGPVSRPEDFWRVVDVAVVPVESGTGIKCKIAEAMLAGRGVVTTPLGMAGFDPSSRLGVKVVSSIGEISETLCRSASPVPREIAVRFERHAAAARYRAFLAEIT